MKKRFRLLAPVLALSLAASLLAGCGSGSSSSSGGSSSGTETTQAAASGDTSASSGGSSSGKDTLIIATANETPSVTSVLHNAVAGDYLNKMTYSCLLYMDDNLEAQPDLAESYEIASDTEWIFHLREGVKFHNGEEMTADDVVASLKLCMESPQVAQYSVKDVEAIDDYTVKVTTDGPDADILVKLSHHGNCILPADLIESGHDFNKEPIGTGPYIMTAWNKGESLEFEAFADYFKGEPEIKHVTWKIIPEGASRTMALEAGEVDLIVEVETADMTRLSETDGVTVYNAESTSQSWMMINNERAPFDNIDFRRAIASAIDKDAIVQVALNGGGSTCDSMTPTTFPGNSSEGAPTYDVEKAKEYMEASGLDPADCGFKLICSDDRKLRAGQVVQSCLKENLGIDIELESMDLATYLDKTAEGDYDAAIGGYTASSMLGYVQGVYHSMTIGSSNKTRLNDPEIDALIDKAVATVDPTENLAAVEELCIALNERCPQVPLYMTNNMRAYDSDITGFNLNAGGNTRYEVFGWN